MSFSKPGNLYPFVVIAFVGILIGAVYLYALSFSSLKNEVVTLAIFFLFAILALYFFYILATPEASISFIIFSSWFVFIEPAPTDIFAGLAIFALIFNIVVYKRSIPRIYFRDIMLLVFIVLNINNVVINAGDILFSLRFFSITLFLVIMSFFISNLSDSYNMIRKQLNLFFIPSIITSFALILGYLCVFLNINLGMLQDILLIEHRSRAFFKDANVAGPFLILAATYSLAVFFNTRSKNKFLFLCLFLLSVIGIFSTLSRGTILALIFGIFVVLSLSIDRRALIKTILSMLLLIIVISAVLLYFPKTNVFGRIYDTQFGVRDRIERIERGIAAFKESPLIGTGMELRMSKSPHDTYFLLLQQIGIIGFLCFWLPIIYLTWKLLINCKYCIHNNDKVVLLSLGATLLSHMILGSVIYLIHWRHFWYLVGLSMAAVRLINIESENLNEERVRVKERMAYTKGGNLSSRSED